LAVNPWSFTRRVWLDSSSGHIAVEVPAMGFAWVEASPAESEQGRAGEILEPGRAGPKSSGRHAPARKGKNQPPLAYEKILQNEYFQATIDPKTGGIQSIHNFTLRGNRLGQQIAMRLDNPHRAGGVDHEADTDRDYSVMVADEISVVEANPLVGRIASRGRLVDHGGRALAEFLQTMEARQGSRVLDLQIDLDVKREPAADPWNCYYAARFAWSDESADICRSLGLGVSASEGRIFESPHFVEVRGARMRIAIMPGGLPYHRRYGMRKLDTLLVVKGETARTFRLALGVDLPQCGPAAVDFFAPPTWLRENAPPPTSRSGWLFHIDARNVLATHWEPVVAEGRVVGFRVRLLETEGRVAAVGLRSFRPLRSARRIDFLGQPLGELPSNGDRMTIDLTPHEWTAAEGEFA
jgi:alpha-mannosidase